MCSTLAAGLKETKKRRRSKGEAEAAIRSISKFGGKKHCNPAQHSDGGEQKTNVKEKKVEDEAGAAEGELKLEVEAGDNSDNGGQGDEGEQKMSATVEKRIKQDSNEIKKGLGKPKDGAANAVQGAGGDYLSTGVREDGGQDIIIWEKVDNQWCELKLETGRKDTPASIRRNVKRKRSDDGIIAAAAAEIGGEEQEKTNVGSPASFIKSEAREICDLILEMDANKGNLKKESISSTGEECTENAKNGIKEGPVKNAADLGPRSQTPDGDQVDEMKTIFEEAVNDQQSLTSSEMKVKVNIVPGSSPQSVWDEEKVVKKRKMFKEDKLSLVCEWAGCGEEQANPDVFTWHVGQHCNDAEVDIIISFSCFDFILRFSTTLLHYKIASSASG